MRVVISVYVVHVLSYCIYFLVYTAFVLSYCVYYFCICYLYSSCLFVCCHIYCFIVSTYFIPILCKFGVPVLYTLICIMCHVSHWLNGSLNFKFQNFKFYFKLQTLLGKQALGVCIFLVRMHHTCSSLVPRPHFP